MHESWVYEREDGETLDLNDLVNIKLRHHDGLGIPEFTHAAVAAPGIAGDYWFGVVYPARTITLDLVLYAPGIAALQNLREEVIRILNPTQYAGTLKIQQANGTVRWFDCVLAERLDMPTQAIIGGRAMVMTVRFRSVRSPFLYDPVPKEYVVASGASGGGPATFMLAGFAFPFSLSQSGVFSEVTLTYPGHVPTPVEIVMVGPGIEPVLRNDSLGRSVGFVGSGLDLPPAGTLSINMDPRARDVLFQGGNGWPYLRESGFWWLRPGVNQLSFEVSGSSEDTNLVMRWTEYYLGL